MDSLEQTATAPMPEETPVQELVVDQVVDSDKLRIFVDLYLWFSGHLVELYVSIVEFLGLREPASKDYNKRVRWTCVSFSETLRSRLNYG